MSGDRLVIVDDPVPPARPIRAPWTRAARVFLLPAGVRLDDVFEGTADLSVADLDGGIDLSPWVAEAGVFVGDGPDPFASYRHPDHVHINYRRTGEARH